MKAGEGFPRTVLGRFWARLRAAIAKRALRVDSLVLEGNSLHVMTIRVDRPPQTIATLHWSTVVTAKAFKEDLFQYDQLCILFELSDGTGVVINEGIEGWKYLLKRFPMLLPSCTPVEEWWKEVVGPGTTHCIIALWPQRPYSQKNRNRPVGTSLCVRLLRPASYS